jgi:hypothetical protein
MALYILQPGCQPLGQFDFLDADLLNVLGGELGVWGTAGSTDLAAADAKDGYVAAAVDAGSPTASRPLLQLADGSTETTSPFYLLDDGKLGYGTLFGQVIGVPVGSATTGTNLGPHTAAASGKVTAWDKPGIYAVSLDAQSVTSTTVGNLYDTPVPGTKLYRTANTGKIGLVQTGSEPIVGVFIELSSNGSLVRTPARLVGATPIVDRMVFNYFGAQF